MTLKNSFLADGQNKKIIKSSFLADAWENMKRRNWVFWLSFLTFLFYFPGYLVLSLNNIRSRYEGVTDSASLIRMQERMDETVEVLFLLNGFMPVLIIGLAVLIGMQGFVYLHNKRQVDFYHSQPVSRKRRFAVLWFNGIVIFIVTYLINMLLGMAVTAVFGCMSGVIVSGAIKAFFMYLLLFFGIYHLSILAILLTGNTLVSLLAIGLLLGYELAARAMNVVLASSFFITYGSGQENKILDTWLSPIVTIYKYILLGGKEYNYSQYAEETYTYGKTALSMLLLAVIFGVVSFLLYQKRASESHGNSISFPKIKEVVRFALLVLFGSFGTYVFYYVAGESVGLGIVGALLSVVLGHAVIQLIYEVDFRAIRKKWLTAAISLVTVILVFLGFKYDWTGYDLRIPKQSQVESVYVSLVAEGFGNSNYVMMDGTEVYHQYKARRMEITDLDTIYKLLENREQIKMSTRTFDGTYETIEINFRLKNGKTDYRKFYLKYEENLGLLDEIYHMEEYQLANNQVMEEDFVENYRIVSATYNNGSGNGAAAPIDADMQALVEAYKKDVENVSYTEVYYNYPKAQISLYGVGIQNEEYRNAWNILIYDSYKNTLALLEEAGIDVEHVFDEAYINSIQKIEVRLDDYTLLTPTGTEQVSYLEAYKTVIYTNPEMYEKILEKAVPETNRWWGNRNRGDDDGYSIYVYTPNPYNANDYYMDEVYFQTGEMPQFILDDLEKVPYGEEQIIK